MTVNELKLNKAYEFECNISEEYKDYKNHDEWGCAFAWFGNDFGVEYNFCIDDSTDKIINCCAIYKTIINSEDYMQTITDVYNHYEIDFSVVNWKEELENAMCKALIKFHNL